jgi:hypothetical protein
MIIRVTDRSQPITHGLATYFTFSGNANDVTGNNNSLTAHGAIHAGGGDSRKVGAHGRLLQRPNQRTKKIFTIQQVDV